MATRQFTQTARFRVVAVDGKGREFAIDETTTYLVVEPFHGPASAPEPIRIDLRNGPHPVNVTDDGEYDVFTGSTTPVRCRRA